MGIWCILAFVKSTFVDSLCVVVWRGWRFQLWFFCYELVERIYWTNKAQYYYNIYYSYVNNDNTQIMNNISVQCICSLILEIWDKTFRTSSSISCCCFVSVFFNSNISTLKWIKDDHLDVLTQMYKLTLFDFKSFWNFSHLCPYLLTLSEMYLTFKNQVIAKSAIILKVTFPYLICYEFKKATQSLVFFLLFI